MLKRLGHRAGVVLNGQAAVSTSASARTFDVVLMDVQMPEMAASSRRRDPGAGAWRRPGHPDLALTAHAMDGDKERCLAAGMNAYRASP